MILNTFTNRRRSANGINEKILCEENLKTAIKKVKQNKRAPGVDKMTGYEIE